MRTSVELHVKYSRMTAALAVMFTFILLSDLFVFELYDWVYYPIIMIANIILIAVLSVLVGKRWIGHIIGFDLLTLLIVSYSFVLTVNMHFSYVFAFMQIYFFISITYPGQIYRFSFNLFYATVLGLVATNIMPEPKLVVGGETIKPFLSNVLLITSVMSFVAYWFFNKQREELEILTQKFATIGKESAFLFHELKAPLSRLLARSEGQAPSDVKLVRQIIHGVEFVVAPPEKVSVHAEVQWHELEGFLRDNFQPICDELSVRLQVSLPDAGEGSWRQGHQESLFLISKTLSATPSRRPWRSSGTGQWRCR